MVNESFFTLMCAGVIGSLFGLLMAFFGYRLFLLLLPIWGFFFGLALGADTIQGCSGDGFLTTITSWVVGFVVGAVFAVLSYLFYLFAVAVIAGSAGYVVTAAVLYGLGMSPGFLVWIIAMIVAVVAIFVTFRFNLQKWVIIIATAILGTARDHRHLCPALQPRRKFPRQSGQGGFADLLAADAPGDRHGGSWYRRPVPAE